MIPSSSDLDAWVAALKTGHAMTEMFPRFVEGYRRLLEVAEKARPCICMEIDEICDVLDPLQEALEALEAPVPEGEG